MGLSFPLVWRIVVGLLLISVFAIVYHRLILPESTRQAKGLAGGSSGHESYNQRFPHTSLGNSLFWGNPDPKAGERHVPEIVLKLSLGS